MRVSRWWLSVHFWVNWPLNASRTSSPSLLHNWLYKYNIFWFLTWFTDDQVSSDLFSTFIRVWNVILRRCLCVVCRQRLTAGTCPTQETKHKHLADDWPDRPPARDQEASWSHKFMIGSKKKKNHLFLEFKRDEMTKAEQPDVFLSLHEKKKKRHHAHLSTQTGRERRTNKTKQK